MRCASSGASAPISSEPQATSSAAVPAISWVSAADWEATVSAGRGGISPSLARDDIGFVKEPKAAVGLQHLTRGVDVAPRAELGGEPLVVDLGHVDGGIPGREQGGGANAGGDLGRQRVHGIAKFGALVGVGVEIVVARVATKLAAHRAQDVVTGALEGVFLLPDLANDLHARVATAGVDAEQPAAGPEGAHERGNDLAGL